MQNTICCTYATEQVTFQLTPSYFLGQMTLNPTIKSCRFVQEHILRFWRNKYFGRNNTFSFWSLNTSKAPVSSAPFYSSGSFETWWAHTSSISFCSTRAYSSHFTFYSLESLRSRGSLCSSDAFSSFRAQNTTRASFPRGSFFSLVSGVPRGTFFSLRSLLTSLTELISFGARLCKFLVDFLADLL